VLLVWDKAAKHVSMAVCTWLCQHNRAVKQAGTGSAPPTLICEVAYTTLDL
jgi:hypothetical protein